MITYITAFIFYTLAMIGILLVGFVIYKKTFVLNKGENKGMIKILDSQPIGPKKTLMVVKIRNEKFLIASGAEHTTFLSKLADDNPVKSQSAEKTSQRAKKSQNTQAQNFSAAETSSNTDEEIFSRRNENRFDDLEFHQSRLDKIQKQFRELYGEEENAEPAPVQKFQKAPERREMIRRLLKDLNETNSVKSGRI